MKEGRRGEERKPFFPSFFPFFFPSFLRHPLPCPLLDSGVLFAYFDYLLESVGFKTCKLGGSHGSKTTSSKPAVFSSFVLFVLVLFRLYIYIFFWGLNTYSTTCGISYHFEILSSQVDPTKKEFISCPGQR